MIHYVTIKPKVYIETTVIGYLVARSNSDVPVTERQQTSRQLWEEYSDNFEFLVSDIVISEAIGDDPEAAQRRQDALTSLTIRTYANLGASVLGFRFFKEFTLIFCHF